MLPPAAIYAAHLFFWSPFAVRSMGPKFAPAERPGFADTPCHGTRYPRLFPILHGVAFGAMYAAIWNSVFHGSSAVLFPRQDIVGCALIFVGSSLTAWSMLVFKSWRLTAQLDAGHQLCTNGPFGIVRHSIYLAFDLMAAGTAVWLPSTLVVIALAGVIVVGDLRARNEERLLRATFRERYLQYMSTTRRFIPSVY